MNEHLKFSDVMPNTVDINRYNYRNNSSFRSPIFLIVYPEVKKFENHCSSWFKIAALLKSQSQLFCEIVPLFLSKEVQWVTHQCYAARKWQRFHQPGVKAKASALLSAPPGGARAHRPGKPKVIRASWGNRATGLNIKRHDILSCAGAHGR